MYLNVYILYQIKTRCIDSCSLIFKNLIFYGLAMCPPFMDTGALSIERQKFLVQTFEGHSIEQCLGESLSRSDIL